MTVGIGFTVTPSTN